MPKGRRKGDSTWEKDSTRLWKKIEEDIRWFEAILLKEEEEK